MTNLEFYKRRVSELEEECVKKQNEINQLEELCGRTKARVTTWTDYILPRCTKEAKEMIDRNHFSGVRIVTCEQWYNQGGKGVNISDIQKCQEKYEKILKESPLEGVMNKITKDILEQKNNAMAMEFTRIICDLLKRYGVYVHCTETKFGEKITTNSIEEQYGIVFDSMDFSQHDKEFAEKIKELEKQLDRSQTTINQIDEILEELFGVAHDVEKPGAFKGILREKVNEKISNFLPTEPIKVAEMLITASGECEPLMLGNEVFKDTYRIFDVSELRQIAEHLLIYCNHNREVEE